MGSKGMSDLKGVHAMRRSLILMMAVGLLIAGLSPAASATGGGHSDRATSVWLQFPAPDDGAVTMGLAREDQVLDPVGRGAHTRLTRHADGVSVRVHTKKLIPKNAYTVWAAIFNNPEECGDDGCSDADFDNEAVDASVIWAGAGGVANRAGKLDVSGHIEVGDLSGVVLFGNGLVDAEKAEIHLVVRGHGMNDPDNYPLQTTTYVGGCANVFDTDGDPAPAEGPYTCGDVQASIHLAS
jgi:hypothetical protein